MGKIRVVIADDVEETRNNVKILLSFEKRIEVIGEAKNGEEAVFISKESNPDIVLMDINMPVMDGIRATEEITASCAGTAVIIISVQGEQEYLKKAMAAGAREYLIKPFTGEDIISAIIKTYSLEKRRREKVQESEPDETVDSKVITVFSTKGGVGKTTVASNLAVSLARQTRKRVALVDLDLQFGDIAIMLNISLKSTISDIVKDFSQLDRDSLEDYMIAHFSGVRVLSAPAKPEYAEYVTAVHVEKIIKLLRETYHYIILDTAANFHETALTSLDMSDKILVVSTLDLPTIKNIKSGLEIMESLRYSPDRVNIILNKASEHYGVKYKDFEETLKYPIWAYIPEDSSTVITSANKGFPFVMTRTETRVAKAIIEMANRIACGDTKPESKGAFRKMLGI